jgi:hypothetical protein
MSQRASPGVRGWARAPTRMSISSVTAIRCGGLDPFAVLLPRRIRTRLPWGRGGAKEASPLSPDSGNTKCPSLPGVAAPPPTLRGEPVDPGGAAAVKPEDAYGAFGLPEHELRAALEEELVRSIRAEGEAPTIHALAHSIARILEQDHLPCPSSSSGLAFAWRRAVARKAHFALRRSAISAARRSRKAGADGRRGSRAW